MFWVKLSYPQLSLNLGGLGTNYNIINYRLHMQIQTLTIKIYNYILTSLSYRRSTDFCGDSKHALTTYMGGNGAYYWCVSCIHRAYTTIFSSDNITYWRTLCRLSNFAPSKQELIWFYRFKMNTTWWWVMVCGEIELI